MNITNGTHTFKIVEKIPTGYTIWNIPVDGIEGYLPLAIVHDNKVNTDNLIAIKCDGVQAIKKASIRGFYTPKQMRAYMERYKMSKSNHVQNNIHAIKRALPYLEKINGYENLKQA